MQFISVFNWGSMGLKPRPYHWSHEARALSR